jgi:very-short-patch-repair endonuclease
MPEHQTLRQRPGGTAYLDFWWERYLLHVELDGLAHLWISNWLADLARTNDLVLTGHATRLRFAGFQLLEQEELVFDQVGRALVLGGWTP